jgi:hypothetical protein
VRFDTAAYPLYWAVILAPSLPYLLLALSYRRFLNRKIEEASARLSDSLKRAYAMAYGDPSVKKSQEDFYHWRTYVTPLLIASVIVASFAGVALSIAGMPLPGVQEGIIKKMATTPIAVTTGALGAYLFGLDDLVRRHATADLSAAAFHSAWVRIAMASAVGGVLNGMLTPQAVAIPLAFAIGTIPLGAIWRFAQEKASLRPDLGKFWEPDLHLLQGLTKDARDRLIQEGIDSVERLACADPVRLLFRTNIEWNVILDIVDQAMLINYVGEKIADLRQLGVRGSIEMADLHERSLANGNTETEIALGKHTLALAGQALGGGVDAAENIAYGLSNDAAVDFVWQQYDSVYPIEENDQAKRAKKKQMPPPVAVPDSAQTPGARTPEKPPRAKI